MDVRRRDDFLLSGLLAGPSVTRLKLTVHLDEGTDVEVNRQQNLPSLLQACTSAIDAIPTQFPLLTAFHFSGMGLGHALSWETDTEEDELVLDGVIQTIRTIMADRVMERVSLLDHLRQLSFHPPLDFLQPLAIGSFLALRSVDMQHISLLQVLVLPVAAQLTCLTMHVTRTWDDTAVPSFSDVIDRISSTCDNLQELRLYQAFKHGPDTPRVQLYLRQLSSLRHLSTLIVSISSLLLPPTDEVIQLIAETWPGLETLVWGRDGSDTPAAATLSSIIILSSGCRNLRYLTIPIDATKSIHLHGPIWRSTSLQTMAVDHWTVSELASDNLIWALSSLMPSGASPARWLSHRISRSRYIETAVWSRMRERLAGSLGLLQQRRRVV